MKPGHPLPRRTCVRALITLLVACAAAKFAVADRKAVEQEVGDWLLPFVERDGDDGRLRCFPIEAIWELAEKHRFGAEFCTVADYDEIVRKGSENASETNRLIDDSVQTFTATSRCSYRARTVSPIDSELVVVRRRGLLGLLDNISWVPWMFVRGLWWVFIGVTYFLALSLVVISYFREGASPGTDRTAAGEPTVSVAAAAGANQERGVSFFSMFWDHLYCFGCLLFGQAPTPPRNDTPSRILYILFKAFAFGLSAYYTALLVNQFQRNEERALLTRAM